MTVCPFVQLREGPQAIAWLKYSLELRRPNHHIKPMSLIERNITIRFPHRVHFTKNVFGLGNGLLKQVLAAERGQVPKVLVVLDESLHLAQPALAHQIETWFKNSG